MPDNMFEICMLLQIEQLITITLYQLISLKVKNNNSDIYDWGPTNNLGCIKAISISDVLM